MFTKRFFVLMTILVILLSACGTANIVPVIIEGTLPPMFINPPKSCFNEALKDTMSNQWFCPNWQEYKDSDKAYTIDIEDLEYFVVPVQPNSIIVTWSNGANQIKLDSIGYGIFFLNSKGEHVRGPVYFKIVNNNFFIEETFKDVIRHRITGSQG